MSVPTAAALVVVCNACAFNILTAS